VRTHIAAQQLLLFDTSHALFSQVAHDKSITASGVGTEEQSAANRYQQHTE